MFVAQCLFYNFSEDTWRGLLLSSITVLLLRSYVWICRHSYGREGQQLITSIRQKEWVCVRAEETEIYHWSFERTQFKRDQRAVAIPIRQTVAWLIVILVVKKRNIQSVFSSPVCAVSRLNISWVRKCQHWTLSCWGPLCFSRHRAIVTVLVSCNCWLHPELTHLRKESQLKDYPEQIGLCVKGRWVCFDH